MAIQVSLDGFGMDGLPTSIEVTNGNLSKSYLRSAMVIEMEDALIGMSRLVDEMLSVMMLSDMDCEGYMDRALEILLGLDDEGRKVNED